MSSMSPYAGQPRPQKRKFRSRASQACDMCRKKKMKCDQARPCRTCQDREFTCEYTYVSVRRLPVAQSSPSRYGDSRSPNGSRTPTIQRLETIQGLGYVHEGLTIPNLRLAGAHSPTNDAFQDSDGTTSMPEADTIGTINQHTSGTEFYGQSSNFVLLNQLLSKARTQLSTDDDRDAAQVENTDCMYANTVSTTRNQDLQPKDVPGNTLGSDKHARAVNRSPMSIVNILYDENSTLTEVSHVTQLTVAGRAQDSVRRSSSTQLGQASHEIMNRNHEPNMATSTSPTALESHVQETMPTSLRKADDLSNSPACFFGRPMLLEIEYVDLFFKNIHYIHPFLDPAAFKTRCTQEIWVQRLVRRLRRDQMHFVALYNAVLAVGALTAGTDLLLDFRAELEKDPETGEQRKPPTSRRLSQLYFQRARRLLGDVFEVCSIESSQTLLLMSIYCQHALKPHACYMYSGMAVRSALAIGLPSNKNFRTEAAQISSQKTWWCIYGQEIEISCTSGRLSSVSNAVDYQISFPENRHTTRLDGATDEAHILIISEIGKLSTILHQGSTELYHSPTQVSLRQKSETAIELDKRLDSWMTHLPSWLNPDFSDLKELEWESKQKLNLTIRFYGAKMFLHRPFIANPTGTPNKEFSMNIEACLTAARKTVNILYEAYKHRYYIRTWWYNSTYALYASVIILYLILLDCTRTPSSVLLEDARKGLKILQAMEEMDVARRSAELVRQVLEVAEKQISLSQTGHAENNSFHANSNEPGDFDQPQAFDLDIHSSHSDPQRNGNYGDVSYPYSTHNSEAGTTREGILARLMGQGLLESFGPGFNDLMLMDLASPISDISLGARGEYAVFNDVNGEYSGHWSWEHNNEDNRELGGHRAMF